MKLTIPKAFEQFMQNIEITRVQSSIVPERQNNIRNALERKLRVEDSFLIGSYKRKTMISPLRKADVDIMIILNGEHYDEEKPFRVLALILAHLKIIYTRTKINPTGQSITVSYNDFNIDIVPAFHTSHGGYLIPDASNKSWIHTNPKKHEEYVTSINKLQDGELIRLIKILKVWNSTLKPQFSSFYFEMMTTKIFEDFPILNVRHGLLHFFLTSIQLVKGEIYDPFDSAKPIPKSQIQIPPAYWQNKLVKAFDMIANAEKSERLGESLKALFLYRKLFGKHFPMN